MYRTPQRSPQRGRSPSPKSLRLRNHSPTAKHMEKDTVEETLQDLGVDAQDVHEINAIMNGQTASRTRKLKENTFSTIVNLNEKWKRHKEKTADLLKESKRRDQQHREKITKLQTKYQSSSLENERLKADIARMEAIVNELQNIKYEQSKERKEKETLVSENKHLKVEMDGLRQSKAKYQERIKSAENDKGKVEADYAKLRIRCRKQEERAIALERELRETKVELEMFEEMLRDVPQTDTSATDVSDLESHSPIGKGPSASRAVANGIPMQSNTAPLYNSTPLPGAKPKTKLSMETGLLNLAREHAHSEDICRQMAEQAADLKARANEMRERDQEISKMLNESL